MKKVLCFIALATFANTLVAQTLDDVRKYIILSKYADAKKSLDVAMADPKNAAKPDAWYFKGVIYNELGKSEATANLCTNCRLEAFEAFKKYQVLEPKNTLMNEEENVRLFDIYNGFYDVAAKQYNAKDYEKALENFSNANTVGSYINSKGFSYKGFTMPAVDTALIQNSALSARLSAKDEIAAKNYEKLVALNLHSETDLDMYQFLVEHYIKTKNAAAYSAILTKAKSHYPTNEYWNEVEMDQIDKKDKKALFAKYEEILSQNKNAYSTSFNYCAEMFNYVYINDPKPADYDVYKAKLKDVLTKTIAIKNTPEANLLMAKAVYNDTYDAQEDINKIKGAKPADIKLRADKKAAMIKMADECIRYTDAAIAEYSNAATLKSSEKANYKNCYNLLESMYSLKGNTAKVAEVKKKGEAL